MSSRSITLVFALSLLVFPLDQASAKPKTKINLDSDQLANDVKVASFTTKKNVSKSITCLRKQSEKKGLLFMFGNLDGSVFTNQKKKKQIKKKKLKKKLKTLSGKAKSKLKKKIKRLSKSIKNLTARCQTAFEGGQNDPGNPAPPAEAVSLDPLPGAISIEQVHYLMDKACFGYSSKESRIRDRMLGQGINGVDELFNRVAEPAGLQAAADDLLNEQEDVSLDDADMTLRGQRMRLVELWANTNNACLERMSVFLLGIFTAADDVVDDDCEVPLMYNYIERLRNNVNEMDMRKLLVEITTDPFMLDYLDGDDNKKDNPNENYAREEMELFSMGPINPVTGTANYTEGGGVGDIDIISRRNAGWHVGEFTNGQGETTCEAIFVPADHDSVTETLWAGTGKDCPADTETDVVNCIFDNRAEEVSLFYASEILKEYLTDNPPIALVQNLAAKVREADFKLGGASGPIATLFKSKAFYHSDYHESLSRQSIEFAMAVVRQLGGSAGVLPYRRQGGSGLERRLADDLKQGITQAPTVFWWDDATWSSPSVNIEKINFVTGLLDDSSALGGDDPDNNPLWQASNFLMTDPEKTARDVVKDAAQKLGLFNLSQADEDQLVEFMINRQNSDGSQDLEGYFPPTDTNIGLGMVVALLMSHDYMMK